MTELKGLKKAQALNKARLESGERIVLKTPIERFEKNKKSLRLAINAKCFDCSGFVKTEITKCVATSCPLFYVRPYKKRIDK